MPESVLELFNSGISVFIKPLKLGNLILKLRIKNALILFNMHNKNSKNHCLFHFDNI